jgi:argininosuccinate lyase
MQDLSQYLWQIFDAAEATLLILAEMIRTTSFNTERMEKESERGNPMATELADRTVREFGMPFRIAHNIISRVVKLGGLSLEIVEEVSIEMYDQFLKQMGLTEQRIDHASSPSKMIAAKQSGETPNPIMMTEATKAVATLLIHDEERAEILRSALSRADDIIKTDYMRLTT